MIGRKIEFDCTMSTKALNKFIQYILLYFYQLGKNIKNIQKDLKLRIPVRYGIKNTL
jgi:hypothetical protein